MTILQIKALKHYTKVLHEARDPRTHYANMLREAKR